LSEGFAWRAASTGLHGLADLPGDELSYREIAPEAGIARTKFANVLALAGRREYD
jgi:hypothetical protein